MKPRLLVCAVVLAVLAASCAAKGASSAATPTTGGGASTTAAATTTKFGTIDSPCGKAPASGTPKVKADEAGGSPDTIRIGVANDRTSTIRPGLLKEFFDASTAFAGWCNAQGGIDGLKVEVVDLDGQVLKVNDAMAKACTGTFAIVGGGWAQDNLMFSGKDGTDFHKCKLVAIPGFAVSPDFAEGNGQVQPIPNPIYKTPASYLNDLVKLYPDDMKKVAVVWGTLPSLKANMQQIYGAGKAVTGFGALPDISYDAIGSVDWNLVAQQVISSGAKAIGFVGEPTNMSKLTQKLIEQNWKGEVFGNANEYDNVLLTSSGPEAVEGTIVRIAQHPFEEDASWPATKQLEDIIKQYGGPDAKVAALSVQGFSADLLFAQSVEKCVAGGATEISRDCVMAQAKQVHSWDGGGLHVVTDPGNNTPSKCSMLVQVKGGKFVRLYPKLKSSADNGQGFSCSEPGIATITGDLGKGNVDPTEKY